MCISPLVSVITPTYNHGRYLGRSIESLLAQTYANWEMVIVVDGSTDNTLEVIQSFQDTRISHIYQQNRGVRQLAATINSGLRRTKGELVTMLPSDDTWPDYRLEKQVPLFDDPNVVLCFGRQSIIDENDRLLGENTPPPELARIRNRPPGSALQEMFLSNFIPQPTVLIRRAALEKIGGYLQPPGLLAEDYPTHMALALQGEFRYLDLPLANYRMHQDQMTRNHYLEMVESDVPYVLEFFRSLDPEMQKRTGWCEADLASALSDRLHNTYFEVGRRELLAAEWNDARRHFLAALRRGTPQTKLKAFLGLSYGVLHKDLESTARLLGRTPLR
ncbi:MAG: glycosyltransferase [Acidobacteriota bacterium]